MDDPKRHLGPSRRAQTEPPPSSHRATTAATTSVTTQAAGSQIQAAAAPAAHAPTSNAATEAAPVKVKVEPEDDDHAFAASAKAANNKKAPKHAPRARGKRSRGPARSRHKDPFHAARGVHNRDATESQTEAWIREQEELFALAGRPAARRGGRWNQGPAMGRRVREPTEPSVRPGWSAAQGDGVLDGRASDGQSAESRREEEELFFQPHGPAAARDGVKVKVEDADEHLVIKQEPED